MSLVQIGANSCAIMPPSHKYHAVEQINHHMHACPHKYPHTHTHTYTPHACMPDCRGCRFVQPINFCRAASTPPLCFLPSSPLPPRLPVCVCGSRRADDDDLRSALDLLQRCLDPNPYTRITAEEALTHPFLLARPE